jgi:hypothetical protein
MCGDRNGSAGGRSARQLEDNAGGDDAKGLIIV